MMIDSLSGRAAADTGLALIFTDHELAAHRFSDAISAAGGRVGAVLGFECLHDRLDQQSQARLLIVDVSSQSINQVDRAIIRVEAFAELVDAAVIVAFPSEMLDTVIAASGKHDTTLLCDPDPAEIFSAVSLAWPRRELMLADNATDIDAIRLKRLADEVHRIARALNGLSAMGDGSPFPARPGFGSTLNDMVPVFTAQPADIGFGAPDAVEIRNVLRLRRLRDRFFDSELFADPAWDILLDLLAARIEGDQVAVSSLCIAAAVPPTTALRWIKTMTDTGLLERHADPMDGRRIFIRLTDASADAMSRYFAAARRMGGLTI